MDFHFLLVVEIQRVFKSQLDYKNTSFYGINDIMTPNSQKETQRFR